MKSDPVKYQVSSGGVIFRPAPDGFQIALIRRSSSDGGDLWCLPKGWVETGETLEATAVREVSEETGLDGRIIRKLGRTTYWFYDKNERRRIHKTVHFFLMEFTGGDTSRHDEEVLEARWFTPEEAERRLAFPGEKEIFKKARTALSKRERTAAPARLLSLGLALALLLSGCVSKATHEALLAQYQESDARNDQLTKRIAKLQDELGQTRKSLDEATARLNSMQSSGQRQESDLDLLSERNVALSKEIETLRRRSRDLTDSLESQKAKTDSLAAEVEALQFLSKTLSGQVEDFKAREDESEKDRAAALLRLQEIEKRLRGGLTEGLSDGGIRISLGADRVEIRLAHTVLFDSSGLDIKPAGGEILKTIAQIAKETPGLTLEVEGHTDNVPIGVRMIDRFPSNWELSTARASRIVRFLITNEGLDPSFVSAAGFADSKPVADNDTAEGRDLNRRIEIVLRPGVRPSSDGSKSQPTDIEVPP